MAESYATSCEKKSKLSPDDPIPQILIALQEELTKLPPSEATKKLKEDITFVETEYKKLPAAVAEYETAYPGFKQSGLKYSKAECEWNEIKKWANNSPLPGKTKEAIRKLREASYRDDTEGHLNDKHPKKVLEKRKEDFMAVKSCLERRQTEDVEMVAQYTQATKFTQTADGWFTELTSLHDQTKVYNDKKKYGALHAVYLEAEQVWQKINDLSAKTPAKLKKKLSKALWEVLQAKDEKFRWYADWLDKEQDVTNAQANYDTFKTNRRRDFIWEAEDVEAADGGTTNAGTDYETGQGPAPYASSPSVG